MDSWCMLQTATHLAASLLMPCLESICTRVYIYICMYMRLYSRDTVCAPVCPPRMQSATMNSSSNERHFPRECTLLPSSSRAFLAFFRLSSRTSYRATIFFHPSRLSSIRSWLLAFQPLRNVSLFNVPQNHSRIFSFFFFSPSLVIHASHRTRFY